MKNLLLIDANSLIHRMYHAMPPLTDKNNNPAGALYGLSNILIKIKNEIRPDYVVALFDRPEPTFRKKEYDKYKAQRPKTDKDLVCQIINAHITFNAFSIQTIELPGYEADDLIGTLAEKNKKNSDILVTIFTGDLDALQLVDDDKVVVKTFKKGISEMTTYNSDKVKDKLGIPPEKVIEYKAIVGDKSDNIPGVSGIGQKGALKILSKFNSIEEYFDKGKEDDLYKKMIKNKDNAFLSKKLATIIRDVPISINIKSSKYEPDNKKIVEYLNTMGFTALTKRLVINSVDGKNNIEEDIQTNNIRVDNDKIVLFETGVKINKRDLISNKVKVGFDLKNLYKKMFFIAPFVDIKIGFQLLGEKFKNEEELSALLFGKILNKNEFLLSTYKILIAEIKKNKIEKIFWDIEMPLIPVLAKMEERGILVDRKNLDNVDKELSRVVNNSRDEIIKKIGKKININSPIQLLEYLNSIGANIKSTSANKLDAIKQKYPIVEKVLAYRTLFKLKTTYLDSYKKIIASDNRIHPTFLQLGASTGRLSCQSPNLQNIPQESNWSSKIRNVFTAPKGFSLVSFDYSQIELRILASVSGDKNMLDAFNKNKDIHKITAHKIFNIPVDDVTHHQRRIAKTLNFGIIYGMGARSFAKQAGLSVPEAKLFIDKYFDIFSSVKEWQSKILNYARKYGRTVNINGRFRKLPAINSPIQFYSAEAERMAINMPLQSVSADIIKLAMIKVDSKINDLELQNKVKMILTIHDELIFEIDNSILKNKENSEVIKEISCCMNNSYKLNIPLKVDVEIGQTLGEMK